MYKRIVFGLAVLMVIFSLQLFAAQMFPSIDNVNNNNAGLSKGFTTQIFHKNVTNKRKKTHSTHLHKSTFKQIGVAKFSVLFWDIYQSKLYTTTGKYPLSRSKDKLLFEINYLRNIDSVELIKRTKEQWQHLNLAKNIYQKYLPELKRIWPNISKGDTLSLLIDNKRSNFYLNHKYIGSITEPEFGQHFIDIWLAKNTSQPLLRAQLLGIKQ
jgi:hypothetical protein